MCKYYNICRRLRASFGISSLHIYLRILGIEPKTAGLCSKWLYLLSHLTGKFSLHFCVYICGIFVCICGIWECHGTCVEVEDRLWELHLSFHDVGSLDRIQVIRLGSKHLFLLSHLLPPSLRFYERTSNCVSLWRCYPCTLILKCILILGAVMYERLFILEIRLCSWITWTGFSYR